MKDTLIGHGLKYTTTIKHPDGSVDVSVDFNLLPQESVNFVASLLLGTGATPISAWYLGIFEGNYVPDPSITAAGLPGVVGECVAYSQASRPLWGPSYDGIGTIGNLSTPAKYNMTAAKTIYGGFVISTSNKGGNTGLILSICRFSEPKAVPLGAEFSITAELALVGDA